MASTVYTAEDAAYWRVPLVRALLAAALACVITFAQGNYSPDFGLFAFGSFALVAGVVGVVLTLRSFPAGVYRTVFLAQSIVGVLSGVLAIAGWQSGLPLLIIAISSWAIISGALELYAGLRSRGRRAVSRDWTFIGAVTAILAIVVLVIPPAYSQRYIGPDHKPRILNTSVMDVGALGVYGAVVAVYLVIAALSLKWGPSAPAQANSEVVS
jgi:uncharacterized membrane protein HdeD (DUF308 family)